MAPIKRAADKRRVEETLGRIATIQVLLEHDGLRVKQAIDRSGLADLLFPVIEDQTRICDSLRKISDDLAEIWTIGQAEQWK